MKLRKLVMFTGIAPAILGASLLGACGGDDDGGGGGGGGTGNDKDYVADLCGAAAEFQKDMEKLFSDPSKLTDEKEAAKAFAEPFEDFANAFAKANPPSDLKDWHKKASDALKQAAKDVKAGNMDSEFLNQDQPFEDPPKDAQERLTKVAADNKDCQEADFDFGI